MTLIPKQVVKVAPPTPLKLSPGKSVEVSLKLVRQFDYEGAFSIGISSRPTKVRDEFLRQADYHIKVQSWNGHLLIYGVKPFTHVHGATFNFDKGYPSLDLIEIV